MGYGMRKLLWGNWISDQGRLIPPANQHPQLARDNKHLDIKAMILSRQLI